MPKIYPVRNETGASATIKRKAIAAVGITAPGSNKIGKYRMNIIPTTADAVRAAVYISLCHPPLLFPHKLPIPQKSSHTERIMPKTSSLPKKIARNSRIKTH